jgi:ubiquitin C-terminal hydrolase
VCYRIVIEIVGWIRWDAQELIQGILKIEVEERQKDDDYVDFRSQDYIGLVNLGATCYINSLLQQLYHTKFSRCVVERGDKPEEQVYKMRDLKTIFLQLAYSIKNVVNPREFINKMLFYGEPINTCVQHDAPEFLLCMFDYIEGEGYKADVEDVFGGYLCNEISVEEEKKIVSDNKEHFNSLTIDIKGKKNLQEALDYLIKPQTLDWENMYFCEELGKKMKADRRCYIAKMPNILILTLKRFEYDFDSQSRHKLNDYFEFPLDLDMHKYSEAFLKNKEESSEAKYKLTGILVHSGSAESGHYYSYIKIG